MGGIKRILVRHDEPIRRALEIINDSGVLIALVVDDDGVLLGSVTDGDVRRGFLRGVGIEQPVGLVCKRDPIIATTAASRAEIMGLMKTHAIFQIPVVDEKGRVIRLDFADERYYLSSKRNNFVVLMAGGLGTRLRPLTDKCPKPLLQIGGKPILQHIIENFMHDGFHRFFISVNYKGEMIEEFFGDGAKLGCAISYIHENEPRGTAGALSLMGETPERPFFVMNGDLLTTLNFVHLLDFHNEHKGAATMCVKEYKYEVPYGVVETDDAQRVIALAEKPQHRFLVNAGIYVLDPGCLDLIPATGCYDMTTLVTQAIQGGRNVLSFPIMENWLDVGQLSDFEKAVCDYPQFQKNGGGNASDGEGA